MLDLLYAHIGTSRTGTTFMQEYVFSKHPDICFLGKPFPDEASKQGTWLLGCAYDAFFEADDVIAKFNSTLATCGSNSKVVPLISEEALWSPYSVPLATLCNRMQQIARTPKVIMTIRNQVDQLRSQLYLQSTWRNAEPSLKWLKREILHHRYRYTRTNHIFYDHAISEVVSVMGKDNVLVLPYEHLKHDSDAFFGRLANFIGVNVQPFRDLHAHSPRNVATGPRQAELAFANFRLKHLKLGRFGALDKIGGSVLGIFGLDCQTSEVERILETDIRDMYRQSNRNLQQMVDFDLQALGYSM